MTQTPNQCDGCKQGMPRIQGIHQDWQGQNHMVCTAKMYGHKPPTPKPVSVHIREIVGVGPLEIAIVTIINIDYQAGIATIEKGWDEDGPCYVASIGGDGMVMSGTGNPELRGLARMLDIVLTLTP